MVHTIKGEVFRRAFSYATTGMFSLIFRRRLDFGDESVASARQRRDMNPLEMEMYKRAMRRELNDRRRHAATCATLICIFICGSMLMLLGVGLTCTGLLVPAVKDNPAPWMVTGPTCIIIGVLILLLSVEIIVKKKKVAIQNLMKHSNNDGNPKKKSSSSGEGNKDGFRVKAIPIWRGMDRAQKKDSQGTVAPIMTMGSNETTPATPPPPLVPVTPPIVLDPGKLKPACKEEMTSLQCE